MPPVSTTAQYSTAGANAEAGGTTSHDASVLVGGCLVQQTRFRGSRSAVPHATERWADVCVVHDAALCVAWDQNLRSTSDPLQSRQYALRPSEDELALALAPALPV